MSKTTYTSNDNDFPSISEDDLHSDVRYSDIVGRYNGGSSSSSYSGGGRGGSAALGLGGLVMIIVFLTVLWNIFPWVLFIALPIAVLRIFAAIIDGA
jgi:hypothetical protein